MKIKLLLPRKLLPRKKYKFTNLTDILRPTVTIMVVIIAQKVALNHIISITGHGCQRGNGIKISSRYLIKV